MKKLAKELGLDVNKLKEKQNTPEGKIFDTYYKEDYEELDKKASAFKVSDFGEKDSSNMDRLKKALESLKKQKVSYDTQLSENERKILEDQAQIDYEKIFAEYGELKEILDTKNTISVLKDFRMKRMLEILNPKIGANVKEKNEKILVSIQAGIEDSKNKLKNEDQPFVRQAEFLEYKQNLSESGHICITPTVEKYVEAIGDRMLTGKSVFLHGPTGTGKTSLARFAAMRFTGKDSEMVFCNPQTKESNVWGKTGIRPAPNGAIETVEIYGPLAKAMVEGKTVIFDEFTALPKEQMVFIKGIFNAKVGDKINIVGNGIVEIRPGFQMIFTANLKSEKNPERQDLPPEIAREFEQNNIKINYINKEEAYDVMLTRLLNKDGSLDMSYYDLNTTLPHLAEVMSEIQESYTNITDKEVARKAGALDVSDKRHSLKKFVMTQGSVVAFKGLMLKVTAEELNLPDDVFALNTIKAMRGKDAIEELKKESGNIKHLTLKEVAELDPFNRQAALMKKQAEELLGNDIKGGDPFLTNINKKFKKVFGKQSAPTIEATYKKESISLDLEQKLQEFVDFYKIHKIDIPADFEDSIREIWERNNDDIQKAIEENGFNEMLFVPGNLSLPDLNTKMTEGYKNATWEGDNFKAGGSFAGAKSQNVDKSRIVLVHKTQNLKDNPELAKTLNIKGKDAIKSEILTLEDYLVFQRKYFKETGKHLDEDGWTWLATKSSARLVNANWNPSDEQVYVIASDLGYQDVYLGARPSRSFF